MCGAVVERLPKGLGELIPTPDEKFVGRAVARTLPHIVHGGIKDRSELADAVAVVLISLAASVDIYQAAMASEE